MKKMNECEALDWAKKKMSEEKRLASEAADKEKERLAMNSVLNWAKRGAFWLIFATLIHVGYSKMFGWNETQAVVIATIFVPTIACALWALYAYPWFEEEKT